MGTGADDAKAAKAAATKAAKAPKAKAADEWRGQLGMGALFLVFLWLTVQVCPPDVSAMATQAVRAAQSSLEAMGTNSHRSSL